MKNTFLLLGLSVLSIPAMAQHTSSYEKSVFHNAPATIATNSTGAKRMPDNSKTGIPGWQGTIQANGVSDLFGPAVNIPGNTVDAKAQYCFDNYFAAAGIVKNEWLQSRKEIAAHASFVDFSQRINGHKVAYSRIAFRFTNDGRLVRVQIKSYGKNGIDQQPKIMAEDALSAANRDLTGTTITEQKISGDWVWFPVPGDNGYTLHPAWPFTINGFADKAELKLSGFVDALTGEVLYRTNEIKDNVDLTVKGTVYKNGTQNAATDEPLADLAITINGTIYYTDTAGLLSDPSLTLPSVATLPLQGRWSKVRAFTASNATPTFNDTITANGTTYLYPVTGISSSRHVNAYYHVNRVHDFMKSYYPTFTDMDIQLPTNVDLTSGTCNAYYNGASINFYAAGGGCNSFAEIGDIIYHEYGHGISDKFYQAHSTSTINNGALNEANSDIWAISITHNPILGQNAYTNGGYIRRYDQAPKVYPQDIQGEVHNDGEIIAGAWWDVAVNIGSVDTMTKLFILTYYDVPDGPNGTEGLVYHDVLMSALMNDDNDNDLSNGTPNFAAIVKAFAKHGIYLLNDADIIHQELAHQPTNAPITVNTTITSTYSPLIQDVKLFYRLRGTTAWDTLTMNNNGANAYTTQIPAQAQEGTIIDYFFAVNDVSNNVIAYAPVGFNPSVATTESTLPYQFGVGIAARDSNQFEGATTGWAIGNNSGDNTTKGIWIQAVPIQSSVMGTVNSGSLICQTGADHTSGTGKCLVTGNALAPTQVITTNAVLKGKTTVISPAFDLTGYTAPVIEYYRWFSNDRGQNPRKDQWLVQVRDTNNIFWKNVDQTYQSDYSWRRRIFGVKQYLPTALNVQVKFTANDATNGSLPNQGQSVVEAAVDDFFIYDNASNSSTGVPNVPTADKAMIYPNPAADVINVSLPDKMNGTIGMYDVTGKVIFEQPTSAGNSLYHINTSQLPSGQYLLVIKSANTIQTKKVTVMH